MTTLKSLIINFPFAPHGQYWPWKDARKRFVPNFMIRHANVKMLTLEIKSEDSERSRSKRVALSARVKGVNIQGGLGAWRRGVAFQPVWICAVIEKRRAE